MGSRQWQLEWDDGVLSSLNNSQVQGTHGKHWRVPHEEENAGNAIKVEQERDKTKEGKKHPG